MPAPTPSQTVGPFFSLGLPWEEGPYVVEEGTAGAIWLRSRVLDGADAPVPDALVESWQPEHTEGRGFGRAPTDAEGRWALLTTKPEPSGPYAPHIALRVFARGLLDGVVTRLYFADEDEANASDPLLRALSTQDRTTLLATPTADGYELDIHLQGPLETAFFDV